MSKAFQISEKLRQQLAQKGYSGTRTFEINRLPNFAIPRTREYNMTTAFLASASLAGLILAKRAGLCHHVFSFSLGSVFVLDYAHRRQLDKTSVFSSFSSGTFEFELEKYPEFKEAYTNVSNQLDNRIAQLEAARATLLDQK